jgi:hypothetical protein
MPIKKLTSAADTMAGPCEDETTTLDTTMTDRSGLAWGADDDDDDEPQRRSWEDAGSAAAVILVGGVAAAVAVYVAVVSHHGHVTPAALPVTTTVSATVAAVAPDIHHVDPAAPGACDKSLLRMIKDEHGYPSVVCTMPSTTTMAAPVLPVDKDARFLALIGPQHLPAKAMDRITDAAQYLCREIAEGDETRTSWIARVLKLAPDMTVDQATFYVNTSIEVYCPQYAND